MKNYLRFLSPVMLLLMAVMFGGGKILAQTSEKFDFVGWKFTTADSWSTNYAQHTVSGNVVDVVFSSANKQSSNASITDCPVTKGKPITVSLKDPNSYNITGVKLLLKQWGSKNQTVTLNVSANGKDFTPTSEKSPNFELNASSLTTKALQFTFSSTSNQVGVQSIEIFYEKENGKTKTTLSFPTPSYTYELGQDGGMVTIEDNIAVLKDKDGKDISDATGKITYSVESSVEDFAILGDENSSGIIVDTNKEGTATVTATFDAAGTDEKYSTSTATYTIKVTKHQTTLSFGEAYDGKTINVNLGDEFTAPTATLTPNIEGATIKYSSNNTAVATVDVTTGAVTIVGAGTTVITADFVGDDTYVASKASYTINVIKVITSIADLKKQGLDDNTEKNFTLKLTDAVVSYVHGANAYMEDASAGILVYLQGKQTLVAGQKFNGLVEVKAQTYNSLPEITSWAPTASMTTETVTELPLQVVTVEELINNYDKYEGRRVKVLGATVFKAFSNKNGEITQNGLSITLRAGATNIKATRNDIVNVIGFPSVYETKDTRTIQLAIWEKSAIEVINTETLTTSAGGYATYSADYAVNYSDLGLTAYTLTVDETNKTVTAKEFTGVVPAGGAVLVKGDASKAYTLTPATTEGDAFVTDLQTGATKADGTQYGFTTKFGTPAFAQVQPNQDIPAKKGYIVLNGASAAKYSICFDGEATGIQTIEAASAANDAMYNLAGQRVDKAYKGIVIVNGKKYLNK